MEGKLIFTSTALAALSIFFLLSLKLQASNELGNYTRIEIWGPVGPESLALDSMGRGPYTGVSDGRILRWEGATWADFAITSPHWRKECNGSSDTSLEDTCGRPLGVQFNMATGDLYIADAYYGLVAVGPEGGLATQLATEAEGEPFCLTNGVDINQENGDVYFTDSSTVFQRRDAMWAILSGEKTGRLMKYDPKSKEVSVLLRGLAFANGVALSQNSTFLLVAETATSRILRFWLQGPKAGTLELFAQLPGLPDNIKRNSRGEFWVALNVQTGLLPKWGLLNSWVRKAILMLPWKYEILRLAVPEHGVAMRFSEEGEILEVLEDNNDGETLNSISEVEESNGTLWIGSVVMPYVGLFKR
ncbi:protein STRICTOSIDINE SYNTHASE-LIKE 10-like [Tasmannia lanceolata]|uniref:protein STRICTOSIDINE SYNTHASE-LIKE 10-like n=1 Tax=Tasmannia lanceolata TaxID=3420 RepID=UPI0040635B60